MLQLLALLSTATLAHAGGFEYPGPGTTALGRGAAYAVRSRDPMALLYNPALLSAIGQAQVQLDVNVAFYGSCVQRSGTYTDNTTIADISIFGDSTAEANAGGYAREAFPQVCKDTLPGFGPALAGALPITESIGIGFGVFAPVTAGEMRWGPDDGSVVGVNGDLRPNPLRYAALRSSGFILYPSVGLGWRALPWLRLGLTLQWGLSALDITSYAVASGGENPSLDARATSHASDFFIPAFIVGAHLSPWRGLEFAAGFRWSDGFDGSGNADIRFGDFGTGQPRSTIPTDNHVEGTQLRFGMPWQLSFGVRYAVRRPRSEQGRSRGHDPLSDELWDVEFDAVYEINERVNDAVLQLPAGTVLLWREVRPNGTVLQNEVPASTGMRAPKQWRNQLSLRLGGDVNLIRARWALRWGLSFESRGVNPSYASVDFLPASRFGLHLGSTVRIGKSWELSVAYAHLFQETIAVAPATEPGGAALQQMAADGAGRVINAGTYAGGWDVVSVGGSYRF